MEVIVLELPPVRLDDHRRLEHWDLHRVGGSSPQLPLASTIPIDEEIRPKPEVSPRLAPEINFRGAFPMNCVRRTESTVPVGDEGMAVEMPTEHLDHDILFFRRHLFNPALLIEPDGA